MSNTPAAVPNDRPSEDILALNIPPSSSAAAALQSLDKPESANLPLQRPIRSYVGALRGPEPSSADGNKSWIPVGTHDITTSVSNGIKTLCLSNDFKENLCKPWSSSVVVRLLGKNLGYAYLCHRLHAISKPVGQLHIVDLDKNCFMVKFANDQDYFKALIGGPWMILDHYLIVHQWDPYFCVSDDLPKKMVAWVRLPHLPIHFYHAQVLTSLSNLVGETIKIEFNTQRVERGKFAWIAVELDLSEPLLPVVLLDGATQHIEYENLPTLCFDCGRIGHEALCCPLKLPAEASTVFVPHGPTISVIPNSQPAQELDQYGPWMVVSRRSSHPRRESQAGKERMDSRASLMSKSEGDLLSRKEIIDVEGSPKSRPGISGRISEKDLPYPSGAKKGSSSMDLPIRLSSISEPIPANAGPAANSKPRPNSSTKKTKKKRGRAKTSQGEPNGKQGEPITVAPTEDAPTSNSDRAIRLTASFSDGDSPQGDDAIAVFGGLPKLAILLMSVPPEQPLLYARIRKRPAKTPRAAAKLKPASGLART
ncbi:hypothetical protein LINPERHAP2_LOCUS21848 [Linum perenne]